LLESFSFDTLFISGHTDTVGPIVINLKLARERAENVKENLVDFGISDQKLITLVDSTKAKNKIQNPRKVSFSFK